MSSIDERVVEMKFNSGQFSKGVSDTVKSLGDLKAGLNLDGAKKGLENLSDAGKNFSIAGISTGVDVAQAKFLGLATIGITALSNITSAAMTAGTQLVKSLTIDPIADGFADYNRKLVSVQTIMNATGQSIEVVGDYFTELDTYADKTIYNLKDMTDAFAKFTNAGVDMDKSVPAIKGIANMVALAGQDAGAAQIAMYNLSQSISNGFLTTTDYRSLNLANVATAEWKEQMIQGAIAAGTLQQVGGDAYHIVGTKASAASTGAALFSEALSDGWASAEVLTNVLGDYGDVNTEIGAKAQAAAQDVKSFSMMMDTLKASVGTGWTDSFELLVGNLTEAKALFTPLTNAIGVMLDSFASARNIRLFDWKELGGRTALIDTLKNAFNALWAIIYPLKTAFQQMFPPTTGAQLFAITDALRKFTGMLILSEEGGHNLRRTVAGLLAPFSILWTVLKGVLGGVAALIAPLFGGLSLVNGGLLGVTANVGDWLVALDQALKSSGIFANTFGKVSNVLATVGGYFEWLASQVSRLYSTFAGSDFGTVFTDVVASLQDFQSELQSAVTGPLTTVQEKFAAVTAIVTAFGDSIKNTFNGAQDAVSNFGDAAASATSDKISSGLGTMEGIGAGIKAVWEKVTAVFADFIGLSKNIGSSVGESLKSLWAGIQSVLGEVDPNVAAGTLNLGIFAGVTVLIKKLIESFQGGVKDSIIGSLTKVTDVLKTMQKAVIADAILKIAGAILVLAGAMYVLSLIEPGRLIPAGIAMTVVLAEILGAMKIMTKITSSDGYIKIPLLSLSLMMLGIALILFAKAAEKFGAMDPDDLAKGLLGIAAALLASNLAKGGKMDAVALILLALALNTIADAMVKLGGIPWPALLQGAATLGFLMVALTLFQRSADKLNAKNVLVTSFALIVLSGALLAMSKVIQIFAAIEWGVFVDGMAKLSVVLGALILALTFMPPNSLQSAASLLILAGALAIMSGVMKVFATMSPEEMLKSSVMLAAVLAILAGAMYIMTGALPGAAALLVVAAALWILAPVLAALGQMSWEAIGKGLAAIAGMLLLFVAAGYLLAPVVIVLSLFAASIGMLGLAAMATGAGLMFMGIGLTAIAAAGLVAIPVFLALIMGLINMIPLFGQKVGEGIVALALVITTSAPIIVGAFEAILFALLDSIVAVGPKLIETLFTLIMALVDQLVINVPLFVIAGMQLLTGILTGIADNIGAVITAGADLIVSFLGGLGDNIPRVVQAGVDLILDFVNGLADGIRNNTDKMNEAGRNLASAIVSGMTSGLTNGVRAVVDGAQALVEKIPKAIRDFLGINSPSKVTTKLGEFTALGMANGLTNMGKQVARSATSVGDSALSALKSSMARVADAVSSNIEMQPTIRPVLDLSSIKKDASLIDGMLAVSQLSLDSTNASASAASAAYRSNQAVADENQSMDVAMSSASDQPMFVQNNYSPKALSNIELYRQTRNQISAAKGALSV